MAYSHRFALFLGDWQSSTDPRPSGMVVDVYDAYDLVHDMFSPGTPWAFTLWHSLDRQATWDALHRTVKLGGRMVFAIDNAVQMNGRVEQLETHVSRNGAAMTVSGRDMSAVALDWDANPAINFRQSNLEDALRDLFDSVGVPLIVGVRAEDARDIQTGKVRGTHRATSSTRRNRRRKLIDRSHPRAGEHVWQLAETMVRRAGLFLWVAPSEKLGELAVVLDRPDYKGDPMFRFSREMTDGVVSTTSNLLVSAEVMQIKDVPSFVRVFGHCARGDKFSYRYAPGVTNEYLTNDRVTKGKVVNPPPYQPRYVKSQRARTYEEANQEADRLIAKAMSKFRTYNVTVQGHGQMVDGAMRLYAINTVAQVRDDVTRIDERMLITRVHFKGARDHGQTTTLTLIPLDAAQLTVGVSED